MSSIWPRSSASVDAAMKNMLAESTQKILAIWVPFDEEDIERKEAAEGELYRLDAAGGEPLPEATGGRPKYSKANKKAAKALHERVIYYMTESQRKRRLEARRNNNTLPHEFLHGIPNTGTVVGYMQGNAPRHIDAPPRSPTEDSQNTHPPPETIGRRLFGGLFKSKSSKKKPPSHSLPHESPPDSFEEPYGQGHSPTQNPHPYQDPASPSKLRRNGSTSSKTRGNDYSQSQTHNRGYSRSNEDRVLRSSSNRNRDRDRDRDRERDRERDRDRNRDRDRRRHEGTSSRDERRYPPSSRHHDPNRPREGSHERSSRHKDDERHRSRRHRYDGEDYEEHRRRRRERRDREEGGRGHDKRGHDRDRDHDMRRHDDPERLPSGQDSREENHQGGDAGGGFHDAESEHRREGDHADALSVSDHINGGLHVTG